MSPGFNEEQSTYDVSLETLLLGRQRHLARAKAYDAQERQHYYGTSDSSHCSKLRHAFPLRCFRRIKN